MAVVIKKSTAVTAGDAFPQTNTPQRIHGARLRESLGFVELASGDSVGSICRIARLRSNDRISRVLLSCDAITTCAADVGVYEAGGVGVANDFFASAQSLATALVNQDVTHESDAADAGSGFGLADVEKPLWEALGLAADTGKLYDITLTLTAAAGSAGTVAVKVQYVDGN